MGEKGKADLCSVPLFSSFHMPKKVLGMQDGILEFFPPTDPDFTPVSSPPYYKYSTNGSTDIQISKNLKFCMFSEGKTLLCYRVLTFRR